MGIDLPIIHLPVRGNAAPAVTLRLLLAALGVGALLLFPSLYYLLRVFKGGTAFASLSDEPGQQSTPGVSNPDKSAGERHTVR